MILIFVILASLIGLLPDETKTFISHPAPRGDGPKPLRNSFRSVGALELLYLRKLDLSPEERIAHLKRLAAARNARWWRNLSSEKRRAYMNRSVKHHQYKISLMTPDQREQLRIETNERHRMMASLHPERARQHARKNYAKHKDKRRAYALKYYALNKAAITERNRLYVLRNLSKVRTYQRNYIRNKTKNDTNYRLLRVCRTRISAAIKGLVDKSWRTVELTGCDLIFLKSYIESKWLPGMSWDNYGRASSAVRTWHIDHKRPCATFELTDRRQLLECFNYTNLQPMWALDNLRKGARCQST